MLQVELDKDNMIRRLTSDLEKCNQQSVDILKVLINVAEALGEKGENNKDTVKRLKKWATGQLEVQQKVALK